MNTNSRTRRVTTTAVLALAATVASAGMALAAPADGTATVATTTAQQTTVAAAASAAASTPTSSASTPQPFQGVLPRPTGPYEAGTEVLHLTDLSRLDPWLPSAGPRQLTVSMFYPARQGTGQPAPYMTLGEAQNYLDFRVPPGTGITAASLAAAQTYAYTGAKAAPGKFPLVVLSPGLENPRTTLTALATELASQGYVVALVGHTYEDSGETLADGTTSTCLWCDNGPALGTEPITVSRAQDVSFVLDQLSPGGHAWQLAHLIDAKRAGMAGHSIGGAATVAAMLNDPRILAGVNMDGSFYPPLPTAGSGLGGGLGGRAFLMLGKDSDHTANSGGDPTWDDMWSRLGGGYARWFAVTGANHASFTDVPVLATQAGIPLPGSLDAARGLQITRAYVTAFFDHTLKGGPEPLLDGSSASYPEVVLQHQTGF